MFPINPLFLLTFFFPYSLLYFRSVLLAYYLFSCYSNHITKEQSYLLGGFLGHVVSHSCSLHTTNTYMHFTYYSSRFLAGLYAFLLGYFGPSFSGHSFSHRFNSSLTALLTAFSFSILSRLDRLFYRPAHARAVRPSPRLLRLCRLGFFESSFRTPRSDLLPQIGSTRITSLL